MKKNKINPALHLQFLLLFLFAVLCTDKLFILLGLFVINLVFLIYHKVYFLSFIQSCKKLTYFYFGLCVMIAIMTLDMNLAINIWIKLTLMTKNIVCYFDNQDWMELLYGLDCFFWPLDYIGISSSRIAWQVTKYFRNFKIYLNACEEYVKKVDISGLNFHWIHICDKIDSTKEIFKMASIDARNKIKQLDDIMALKLFIPENSRSNYHVAPWQPLDFIFLVILIFLLASEVIL